MNLLKWVLIGVGPFLIIMVLGVVYLSKFAPAVPEDEQANNIKKSEEVIQVEKKINRLKAGASKLEIREIKNELKFLIGLNSNMQDSINQKQYEIDSLNTVITEQKILLQEKDEKLLALTDKNSSNAKKDANAKDLSRTFASMKVREIGPIINNLDDKTVIKIYHQMSKTSRKNLLLALSNERAAKLTKLLIN